MRVRWRGALSGVVLVAFAAYMLVEGAGYFWAWYPPCPSSWFCPLRASGDADFSVLAISYPWFIAACLIGSWDPLGPRGDPCERQQRRDKARRASAVLLLAVALWLALFEVVWASGLWAFWLDGSTWAVLVGFALASLVVAPLIVAALGGVRILDALVLHKR